MTPTIRDVADKAQVSVATVSRVLNESGYAESETRARVLKAAADLNYQRNIHWSRLKSQSSQTILFLLGNRQSFNAMHMRLLVACERTLKSRGYDLVFSRFEYSGAVSESELPLPRMLEQSGAVDGVILAGVHHSNLLRSLEKRSLPYTILGNSFQGSDEDLACNAVFYDDPGGVEEAAEYLIRLGHSRISFVGNASLPWFQRRHAGFRSTMRRHGLTPHVVSENWQVTNIEYGQLATTQLLREFCPPTAILAANDEIAAGVWKELVRRRIEIPAEMSLIGIGDRAEYAILEPALTSIAVFEEGIGERLTSMLLARIEDPKRATVSETYPCKLIERASCAPLAKVRILEQVS